VDERQNRQTDGQIGLTIRNTVFYGTAARDYYVAAKATYIRLLHGKIGFFFWGGGGFGPRSVKRGRTHIVLG